MLNPVAHSHCHYCGTAHVNETFPKTCAGCGTVSWINPVPVAVLLQPVTDGTRRGVLVGLRGMEPARNTWGLVGGFGECSDDGAEAGMCREKDEETRLTNRPKVQLMFSGGSGPLDKPHLRQWLIFGYADRPIHIDSLAKFEPDEETLALDVAWEPRELSFPLHTKALALFLAEYQDNVHWDEIEDA